MFYIIFKSFLEEKIELKKFYNNKKNFTLFYYELFLALQKSFYFMRK